MVCGWLLRFRRQDGFAIINHHLVMQDRQRVEREASPTAAVIDSQSVKTVAAGGRPMVIQAHSTGIRTRQRLQRSTRRRRHSDHLDIVKKIAHQVGFEILPRRWVVEPTCAWFDRHGRRAKDFAATGDSAAAFLYVASVMLLTPGPGRSA
jgi:putative transposase